MINKMINNSSLIILVLLAFPVSSQAISILPPDVSPPNIPPRTLDWIFVAKPPSTSEGAPSVENPGEKQILTFTTLFNQTNAEITNFEFGNFSLDDSEFNGIWTSSDFTVKDGILLSGHFTAIWGRIPGGIGGSHPVPKDTLVSGFFNVTHPIVSRLDNNKGRWDLIKNHIGILPNQQNNIVESGDLVVIPVPSAFFLFFSGIIGLICKHKSLIYRTRR